MSSQRGGRAMRMRGLIRKEFLQVIRDPSSIAIAFIMPVFLLLLFGYGVSLDARHVPIGLVIDAPEPAAMSFVAEFSGSRYFEPHTYLSMPAAENALASGDVRGIIHLRSNFEQALKSGQVAPIQLLLNGVDANTARLVSGYVQGVWLDWLQHRAERSGRALAIPVEVDQRIWFNPEVRSRDFLVPGLVAIIMTLIGALLTALVVAREWERGTMEALLVTPVSMTEILLGKLIPYFLLGTGGMLLSVAMAVWVFQVPLRGSFGVLFACASLFLLVALGMGLLISTVAKNQFVAGQVAIIATFLPAFILSGFIFDIHSMPAVVQGITFVIAARYFVSILQSVFLAGNVWSVIMPNALALLLMVVFFFAVARRKSRKRLD